MCQTSVMSANIPQAPQQPKGSGPANEFEALVQTLKDALGESSGLTSDDVDVDVLSDAMARYPCSNDGWIKYAFGDAGKAYTRNLVDEGNGKSNLLVLVWTPGKGSPIHDHGNAHCIMKILRGNLTETRYDFPNGDKTAAMEVKSQTVHSEDKVAYMSDDLGVHRVSNEGSDFAVSLHLYTPPNVAKKGCNMFDPVTGKTTFVSKCGYHSAYGRLLED